MKKQKLAVNMSFVWRLLGPLWGGADDDRMVEHYRALDPNDEASVRKIIRDLLKPDFLTWNTRSRAITKLSLQFALSKYSEKYFGSAFLSVLPPFDAPDDARSFFVWLWEELFGPEDYHLSDLSDFVVVNDVHAPNLVFMPDKQ